MKLCLSGLLVIIAFSTAGCTAGIRASRALDKEAKRFDVPAGSSLIYICRDHQYFGSAVLMRITVDGTAVASLGPGEFAVHRVELGEHSIWTEMGGVTPPIPAKMVVYARPNTAHFVRAALKPANLTTNKIVQEELAQEAGQQAVRNSWLVQWQSE